MITLHVFKNLSNSHNNYDEKWILAGTLCPGVAPLRFGRPLRAIEPLVPANASLRSCGRCPKWPCSLTPGVAFGWCTKINDARTTYMLSCARGPHFSTLCLVTTLNCLHLGFTRHRPDNAPCVFCLSNNEKFVLDKRIMYNCCSQWYVYCQALIQEGAKGAAPPNIILML